MKIKLALITACVALASTCAIAQVTLPFADGFDYPEGERLGTGSSAATWNVGNSPGTGSPEIRETATLTYPGLVPLGGRGVLSSGVPGSNRDRGVSIGSPAGALTNWADLGVLYVSYLLRIDAGPTGNPRLISAYRDSSGTAGGFTPSGSVFVGTDRRLGIGKGSSADVWTTSLLSTGTTHLIVLKYQFVEGTANDIMSLWLNPPESALGVPEAQVPSPTITTTAGSDDAAISTIQLTLRTAVALNGGGTYAIDDFRLGTTWADVTPVPEPSVIALSLLGGFGVLWLRLRKKQ